MLDTPLWIQQGQFSSQLDRLLISTLLRPGIPDNPDDPNPVLPAVNDLRCTANGSRLAIDIAAGTVVIGGTDQVRQGNYVCRSTSTETVDLDPRPASGQSRRDLIYAQVQDSSAGADTLFDGWVIAKATGVPTGATPVVPALPPSAIALANVLVTASGGPTITQAEITDLRRRSTTSVRERQTGIVSSVGFVGTSGNVGNTALPLPGMSCTFTALAGRSYVCKFRAFIQRLSNAGQMVASWPIPGGVTPLPSGSQIIEHWTPSLAVNAVVSAHWEWAFTCEPSIHGQAITLQLSLAASGAGGTGRLGNGDARWGSQTWVELI